MGWGALAVPKCPTGAHSKLMPRSHRTCDCGIIWVPCIPGILGWPQYSSCMCPPGPRPTLKAPGRLIRAYQLHNNNELLYSGVSGPRIYVLATMSGRPRRYKVPCGPSGPHAGVVRMQASRRGL